MYYIYVFFYVLSITPNAWTYISGIKLNAQAIAYCLGFKLNA